MESTYDGRGPAKESSSNQFSNRDNAQPLAVVHPHTMHYSNHGDQPYQGYSSGPGYADEYHQPQGYNHLSALENSGCSSFMRGFIMGLCIIATAIFVGILIISIALNPNYPIYKVTSVSVVNFNTIPTLTGDWNTSFTVKNTNNRLKGHFPDFRVDVIYKNEVIAVGYENGFELDKSQQKPIDVKASSSNVTDASVIADQKYLKLDEMTKERESGSMMFVLKISSLPSFKSSLTTSMGGLELGICEGVKVVFQNNTGTGTLDNGGRPIDCHTYIE